MYKLVVLLAIAAVALASTGEEVHDQKTAEQFYYRYGYYPQWYTPAVAYKSYYTAPAATYSVKYAAPASPVYSYAYSGYPYPYAFV